jgi:hypothetical protein
MYSIPLGFFIWRLSTVLFALGHFVGLNGFGLIVPKIYCKILRPTTIIIKNPKTTLSALIYAKSGRPRLTKLSSG